MPAPRSLRIVAFLALAGFSIVLLSGCPKAADPWPAKPGPRVLVSFAPLYCFANNIADDDANVLPLMTSHGPHGFSDTPADALKLKRADLFIINGLELDNVIAKRLVQSSGNRGLRIVPAGEAIPKEQLLEGACHHDHEGEEHEHEHGIDPHVWLGIPEAIMMVEKIRDELAEADAANAENYRRRTSEYVERLKTLQQKGRELLKGKKARKLVTFHDSLRYFARSFDLDIVDVIEVAPGSEPGVQKLKDLVKVCQENKVRLIAVEPQYPSNTSAKTILTELRTQGIDAEFVEIDPLETASMQDLDQPDFYERKMLQNLKNLADKLK